MTIQSQNRTAGPFVGTGAIIPYPFTFKVFSSADLLVVRANPDGSQTVLSDATDYDVTLNADQEVSPGGTVVLTTGLAVGYRLTLTSSLAVLQKVLLTNQGGFYPKVISDALDRLTINMQETRTALSRSIKLPLSSLGAVVELPGLPAALGRAIIIDDNGNVTVSDVKFNDQIGIVSGLVSDAASAANAAATSQTLAAVSAGAAQDAAALLNEYLDDVVVSGLVFPYDMGLISDPVVVQSFDLGTI